MTIKRFEKLSRSLISSKSHLLKDPLIQCLVPQLLRPLATEALSKSRQNFATKPRAIQSTFNPEVLTTIYQFPTMEPLRFESYSSKHLSLPLRRDILHRAVVFEGDSTRQGTASTKTRFEVHGSHRKIRPQKGTGKARLGHRQSPAIVGGGVVFGPKPRDFSTRLPRKIYDLAWRTALSWRYRRGELIVCEDDLEIKFPDPHYLKHILEHNHWGKPNGRSLFVVNGNPKNLIHAMNNAGEDGKVRTVSDLDVKNLLEMGRVVIEKRALDMILDEHQSDLKPRIS